MKIRKFIFAFSLLVLAISACTPSATPTPPPTPITIQLNWLHYGFFGGLYAADQNGIFAQEGLAVTFIEGGATVDYITPVFDGTAQFGIASADVLIQARAEGKPVPCHCHDFAAQSARLCRMDRFRHDPTARLRGSYHSGYTPGSPKFSCHDGSPGYLPGPVYRNRPAIHY